MFYRNLLLVFLFVAFAAQTSPCQDVKSEPSVKIECQKCTTINNIDNKYCSECGNKLSFIKKKDIKSILESDVEYKPGRLFSISTAEVLNSLDLSLLLGGSFGISNSDGFLGTVSLGLGGFGNVEISTTSFIGSIFSETEQFPSVGLKILVLREENHLPGLSIGLKTNNKWNNSSSDNIAAQSPELSAFGLQSVSYDTRITTLYAAFSINYNPKTTLHAGLGLTDIRYKNVAGYFTSTGSYYYPDVQKKNVISVFGGMNLTLNDKTNFIFEIQSLPYLKADAKDGKINPSTVVVGACGLRFKLMNNLLIDSGVRYQDNYKGLADAEIKVALNYFMNFGSAE